MWTDEIKKELTGHIIPFWLSMKDEENGGFYGYLSYDLELNKKADKGCILNSRILWFFSHAYDYFSKEIAGRQSNAETAIDTLQGNSGVNSSGNPDETVIFAGKGGNDRMPAYTLGDLKIAATHAYRFLRLAMLDIVNGGVYWSSAYDGLPGDTLKHTYCQAFAIYGLAAYYEISKDQSALDLAYEIMDVIETKCRDEKGYLEAFTMDWQPHSNEELSENGVEAKRTMNTLLHCFEAYTELYRVDRNEKVRKILIEEANLFMQYYYNPERKRQEVFFDLDYNTLIDLHSYGHDIETSWLMEKGIDLIDDAELTKKMKPAFRAMEEHTFEAAFDETAFINECENGVDDTKRIWWVECEAIIGFVNRAQHEAAGKMMAEGADLSTGAAGELTNKAELTNKDETVAFDKTKQIEEASAEAEKYLQAAKTIWAYVRDNIVDQRPGSEWLSEVDVNNEPFSKKPIVEEWKCPYHNGRMCLEVLTRLS